MCKELYFLKWTCLLGQKSADYLNSPETLGNMYVVFQNKIIYKITYPRRRMESEQYL